MTTKKKPMTTLSGTDSLPETAVVDEPLALAEPAVPVAEPVTAIAVEALPEIDIATFCAIAGIKWDQLAGFRSYAQRVGLIARSVPAWREAFQNFMARPC